MSHVLPEHHVLDELGVDGAFSFASSFAIDWMPDSRRLVMSATPAHGGPSRLLIVDVE